MSRAKRVRAKRRPADEPGYFADDSILRKVHSERAVGLYYGQRALAIGAINPLNYIGTALHTKAPDRPFARIADTAILIETVILGSKTEADRVLARVARMHERVEGKLPKDAGSFAAGTSYSANDPHLMLWTVAVIADSAVYFYERFIEPLSSGEKEELWQEYLKFAGLFGMDPAVAPPTYEAFRRWFDAEVRSPNAHLTPGARSAGRAIVFDVPFPWYLRGYAHVRNLLLSGSLPSPVLDLYGIKLSLAQTIAYGVASTSLRASVKVLPRRVTRGSSSGLYARIKDYEKRRIASGAESTRIVAY